MTIVDTQINTLFINRVKAQFPNDGVLGEEASYNENSRRLWIVDPLDGTALFIRDIPLSTFCLALTENGQPIVSVVYDPYTQNYIRLIRVTGLSLTTRVSCLVNQTARNN